MGGSRRVGGMGGKGGQEAGGSPYPPLGAFGLAMSPQSANRRSKHA